VSGKEGRASRQAVERVLVQMYGPALDLLHLGTQCTRTCLTCTPQELTVDDKVIKAPAHCADGAADRGARPCATGLKPRWLCGLGQASHRRVGCRAFQGAGHVCWYGMSAM
jgi:hypothetical protein